MTTETTETASPAGVKSGYAPVRGLQMYYEIHGTGRPLVLLHGAFSGIGTSFGALLPGLAQTRQVIAVELQGHGRTADIDRPLTIPNLAKDTAALIEHLGVGQADVFGYSMGAGAAFELAIKRPDLVRKLIVASLTYNKTGFHPEMLGGMDDLQPEQLAGTPWQEEYARLAPNPDDWPALVEKVKQMDREIPDWPASALQNLQPPTLLLLGDSDIVRPEHAVEMFRLLGGGVAGDLAGLPQSRLAVLPGTTHVTLVNRADWLVPMITDFLDAPLPEAK